MLSQESPLRTQKSAASAAPSLSSLAFKPITSDYLDAAADGKKVKKKEKGNPQLTLTHDKHLPIVLHILHAERENGTIFVPFKAFKKELKKRCPPGSNDEHDD